MTKIHLNLMQRKTQRLIQRCRNIIVPLKNIKFEEGMHSETYLVGR